MNEDKNTGNRDEVRQRETLRPEQERAIVALLTHPTITDAANEVGVSRRTLHRWLQDPDFQMALQAALDAQSAALGHAMAGLAQQAVETLQAVLIDPKAPPGVRVRAALGVLGQRRQFLELEELTQRVAALERGYRS